MKKETNELPVMEALNGTCIIEVLSNSEFEELQTESKIFIRLNIQQSIPKGRIVQVSENSRHKNKLQVGDVVSFSSNAGWRCTIEGKDFLVIYDLDIHIVFPRLSEKMRAMTTDHVKELIGSKLTILPPLPSNLEGTGERNLTHLK